jgi:hypothetical protein
VRQWRCNACRPPIPREAPQHPDLLRRCHLSTAQSQVSALGLHAQDQPEPSQNSNREVLGDVNGLAYPGNARKLRHPLDLLKQRTPSFEGGCREPALPSGDYVQWRAGVFKPAKQFGVSIRHGVRCPSFVFAFARAEGLRDLPIAEEPRIDRHRPRIAHLGFCLMRKTV